MGVVPSKIASGTCGTCNWEIANDGKFTVGAGKLANPALGLDGVAVWPWTQYATDITSADMTAAINTSGNCDSMFRGCSNMTAADLRGLDLSDTTVTAWMFYGCSSLSSLDMSTWDFDDVVFTDCMFLECGTDSLVLDLSGWDTSGVTSAIAMFTTYGESEVIAEIGNKSYTGGRIVTGSGWTLELALPPQNYTTSVSYTWHKVTGWETALTECYRCDSSGNAKPDGGGYVAVEATWSMSTIGSAVTQTSTGVYTYMRDDITPVMTGTVTIDDRSTYSTFTGTLATSGTAAIIAANLNELDVSVVLSDGSVTKSYSATVRSGVAPLFSSHKSNGAVDGIGVGATWKEGYVNNGFPQAILDQPVPPTFYYATKPAESDLPVTPCIVIQTSDWSVWYADGE